MRKFCLKIQLLILGFFCIVIYPIFVLYCIKEGINIVALPVLLFLLYTMSLIIINFYEQD